MKRYNLYAIAVGLLIIIGTLVSIYIVNRVDGIDDRLNRANSEYQMVIEDDSLILFDGDRLVGKVKLQGQLDSLIIEDNQ